MNFLRASFAPYWQSVQHALFPQLEQVLGPLTAKQQQLVQTLEVIRVEHQIPRHFRAPGRPPKDRAALARAFVAKAVYDMPTTRVLLDRLDTDVAVRRICGWERRSEVPSESVFSRAFAEFAATQLAQRTHEALIRETHHDRLVGHLSRDSTAIEAREKPVTTDKAPPPPKRKRGRPKKGEERPKAPKTPRPAGHHEPAGDAFGSCFVAEFLRLFMRADASLQRASFRVVSNQAAATASLRRRGPSLRTVAAQAGEPVPLRRAPFWASVRSRTKTIHGGRAANRQRFQAGYVTESPSPVRYLPMLSSRMPKP